MELIYNKHYIRTDDNGIIIHGFSDAYEKPNENDICINEQGGQQFRLIINGELSDENPLLIDSMCLPLYKYINGEVVEVTDEEKQPYIEQMEIARQEAERQRPENQIKVLRQEFEDNNTTIGQKLEEFQETLDNVDADRIAEEFQRIKNLDLTQIENKIDALDINGINAKIEEMSNLDVNVIQTKVTELEKTTIPNQILELENKIDNKIGNLGVNTINQQIEQLQNNVGEVNIGVMSNKVTQIENKVNNMNISEVSTKVSELESKVNNSSAVQLISKMNELEAKVNTLRAEYVNVDGVENDNIFRLDSNYCYKIFNFADKSSSIILSCNYLNENDFNEWFISFKCANTNFTFSASNGTPIVWSNESIEFITNRYYEIVFSYYGDYILGTCTETIVEEE